MIFIWAKEIAERSEWQKQNINFRRLCQSTEVKGQLLSASLANGS
jgi:hypothetical protein